MVNCVLKHLNITSSRCSTAHQIKSSLCFGVFFPRQLHVTHAPLYKGQRRGARCLCCPLRSACTVLRNTGWCCCNALKPKKKLQRMTHCGESSPSPLPCVQIPTAHYSDYDWTIYSEKEAFNKTAGFQWALQNTGCTVLHLNATLQVSWRAGSPAGCQTQLNPAGIYR